MAVTVQRWHINMNVSPASAIQFKAYLALIEKVKLLTTETKDVEVTINSITFKPATKVYKRGWEFRGRVIIREFRDGDYEAGYVYGETFDYRNHHKTGWFRTEDWTYVCVISDDDIDAALYGLMGERN